MKIRRQKAKRLEEVARLYYEENWTQQAIAARMEVSRPFISRMLQEAREAGIVEIRIHPVADAENPVLARAMRLFGLKGGVALPGSPKDDLLNQALAQAAMDYVRELGGGRLGLGWGHIIGVLVRLFEQRAPAQGVISDVCPMVGNSGVSIRNYHSNENVRIVAHQAMAAPHYLHTPAFAETRQEMDLQLRTENYKAVKREWERLDIALVNIGNHPSTPDFASIARYGDMLVKKQAVGRMIAYYFTVNGEILHSDADYAIQIPLADLARCRHVVGICSANVNKLALAGALRTGLLSHIIAGEDHLHAALTVADPR